MRYNNRAHSFTPAMKDVKTPCIGICSTTSLGDRVCRGCKRYAAEVIHWNSYDETAKGAVLARIEQLVVQLLDSRFQITAPDRLRAELRRQKIPFNPDLSAFCWLHNLLKKGLDGIDRLESCGVRLQPAHAASDLASLSAQIDEELLCLSEAHFDRYIAPIKQAPGMRSFPA